MAEELTFDENKHEYRCNGVVIPSVTQIIRDVFPISDFVSKNLLEEKADLGRKIHTTTELYDKERLDIETLHPTLKNYLNNWINFKNDYNFVPIEIELMGYHHLYNFAYRIDRIGLSRGEKVLLDIKSGTKQKTHALQTAGYQLGYNNTVGKKEQVKKRLTVYLSETEYKVEPNNNTNDQNVFLAALTIYNYKRSSK